MAESTNKEKYKHGASLEASIQHLLELQKQAGYLEYEINHRAGRVGYKNQKQFRSPIKIKFLNGNSWLIYTTTTYRSDRFKGKEWDAFNLREIEKDVTKIFMVYPDALSEDEKINFKKKDKEIVQHNSFSFFDRLIPQWEFTNFLENEISREYSSGKKTDYFGRNFEERILFILNNSANLEKWTTGNRSIEGYGFDIFSMILNVFNVHDIIEIFATNKIKKLPSGGNPKTDILVEIKDSKGKLERKTLSLKRSSAQRVTVHEYSANTFADVLDRGNIYLRELLNAFQEAGGIRNFKLNNEENVENLTLALKPYLDKLGMWVLSGEGGPINDESQIAQYILTYSTENGETNIYPIPEYYQMLKENIKPNSFGTVFSWTYPSGKKGKRIQLKLPILHNF